MPAVSAKGGLMMGTLKVGALPSRPKRAGAIITYLNKGKSRPESRRRTLTASRKPFYGPSEPTFWRKQCKKP